MSIKLMSMAWQTELQLNQKAALLALCDWANDDGASLHPSISAVAGRLTCSERTAQRLLKDLIDTQWLAVVGNLYGGKPGATRKYRINIRKLKDEAERCEALRQSARSLKQAEHDEDPDPFTTVETGDKLTGVTNQVETGDNAGMTGVTNQVETGDMGVTQPTKEPPKNHQGTAISTAGGEPQTGAASAEKIAESAFMVITDASGKEHLIPAELRYPGDGAKTHRAWVAYAIAYEKRYGVWPIWNASIGGRMSQLIDRIGAELAPRVAYHYVSKIEDVRVQKEMHSVALLLSGAEKWATQLRAGIKTPEVQQARLAAPEHKYAAAAAAIFDGVFE